jgi:hypothetical protein
MSQSEVLSLMDDILNLFKSHPDCESKINDILRELSRATGFDAGNIRDIVERFKNDGIVYTADIPNESSSAGTAIGGFPAISFSPGDDVETSARTMIGEMIHWAGLVGPFFEGFPYSSYYGSPFGFSNYYTDAALAAAGHKVGLTMSVEQYRRTYPDIAAQYKGQVGSDWADSKVAHHGAIDNACGTPNFYRPQFAKP